LTEGKENWFGEGLDCKILKPGTRAGRSKNHPGFEPEELEVAETQR